MTRLAQLRQRFNTVRALVIKESRQILRDPSVYLIAFFLPAALLFLFAYAVSLDIRKVPVGVVLSSTGARADSLAAAFAGSRYFSVHPARNTEEVENEIIAGRLYGMVVIPADFEQRLSRQDALPAIQIITDGTQPNTANFVAAYAQGVFSDWLAGNPSPPRAGAELIPRFWYNPEIESRKSLIPGAIAIVMTIIGTLLTALVIAREWERGTMEAILSTPAGIAEIILGKLIPYFVLGLLATIVATLLAIHVFGVSLTGSWLALTLTASAFLVPALGQGLLISTASRNQFIASQVALFSGFLPAFLLSGFLYQISAMPLPIRLLSAVIPARYFVDALQTIFLTGDVWPVLWPDIGAMLLVGAVFFLLVRAKTRRSLDT
jgi:ABC-type multidrug transport system, permease component